MINEPVRGVNLAGGEFGDNGSAFEQTGVPGGLSYANPGTYGTTHLYPEAGDFEFLASRLADPTARLNFRIERLAQGIGQPLRPAEVARFRQIFDDAHAAGVKLIPTPWNFGAVWDQQGGVPVRKAIGSDGFTIADFADFWARFTQEFGNHPALAAVGLMTEPVGIPVLDGEDSGPAPKFMHSNFSSSLGSWEVPAGEGTATTTSGNAVVTSTFGSGWGGFLFQNYLWPIADLSGNGTRLVARVRLDSTHSSTVSVAIALSLGEDYEWSEGSYVPLTTGQWVDVVRDSSASELSSVSGILLDFGGTDVNGTVKISVESVYQTDSSGVASTPARTWEIACQSALDAIRGENDDLFVWVPNYGYSTYGINTEHPRGPWIEDPTGNFGYEGHHYSYNRGGPEANYTQALASATSQGFTSSGGDDALIVREFDTLSTFKAWLGSHRGFIGEWGIPHQSHANTVGWPQWKRYAERMLEKYEEYGWPSAVWTSGRALGPTASHYTVYYASNGWNSDMDSGTSVAGLIEPVPPPETDDPILLRGLPIEDVLVGGVEAEDVIVGTGSSAVVVWQNRLPLVVHEIGPISFFSDDGDVHLITLNIPEGEAWYVRVEGVIARESTRRNSPVLSIGSWTSTDIIPSGAVSAQVDETRLLETGDTVIVTNSESYKSRSATFTGRITVDPNPVQIVPPVAVHPFNLSQVSGSGSYHSLASVSVPAGETWTVRVQGTISISAPEANKPNLRIGDWTSGKLSEGLGVTSETVNETRPLTTGGVIALVTAGNQRSDFVGTVTVYGYSRP